MKNSATAVSILTGQGQSGIAIAALAGPDARKIAARVFRPRRDADIASARAGTLVYGRIYDGDTEIDEALLGVRLLDNKVWFVELNCHGGTIPVRKTVEILKRRGAELMNWREFSRKFHPGNRIAAEAGIRLAQALTERAAAVFADQVNGALSNSVRQIAVHLSNGDAGSAVREANRLLMSEPLGRFLARSARVVIAGAPNVGKSSLLNALVGSQRAIVHHAPGTTRDVVSARWSVRGLPVMFADTAGLRASDDAVEIEGVKLAHSAVSEADLVLYVADLSRPLAESKPAMFNDSGAALRILVANKADLDHCFSPEDIGADASVTVVTTSAITGEGVERLAVEIERVLLGGAAQIARGEPVLFVGELADILRDVCSAPKSAKANNDLIAKLLYWID